MPYLSAISTLFPIDPDAALFPEGPERPASWRYRQHTTSVGNEPVPANMLFHLPKHGMICARNVTAIHPYCSGNIGGPCTFELLLFREFWLLERVLMKITVPEWRPLP